MLILWKGFIANRNRCYDHLIPQCNTRDDIYGNTNGLNLVPCCRNCNSAKSSKSIDEIEIGPSNCDDAATNQCMNDNFKKVMPKVKNGLNRTWRS